MTRSGATELEQRLYAEIGRYVVCFQELENQLVLICWLCWDPANGPGGRRGLADLTFSQLVTKTSGRVHEMLRRKQLEDTEFRQGWREYFDATMKQCRAVAVDRNTILHSTYVHLEGGDHLFGIVRSDMQRGVAERDVTFDQEWIGPDTFKEPLIRLIDAYKAVAHCKMQITHWP